MTGFDLISFALFIGLDVGKTEHHATALSRTGEKVYDKALPNDQTRLHALLAELTAAHGPALLVVDQPATIGALPVAVAQQIIIETGQHGQFGDLFIRGRDLPQCRGHGPSGLSDDERIPGISLG